jgi:hypothetical protein
MTWHAHEVFMFSCKGHLEVDIERNFILKYNPKQQQITFYRRCISNSGHLIKY